MAFCCSYESGKLSWGMRMFACMASSLDGRIGPSGVDHFVALGSRYDLQHLVHLRDEADAVLFGASTFRAWPRVHWGTDPKRPLHHFIMSRRQDLDPRSELFQHPDVPITIISSSAGNASAETWPEHVEVITVKEGPEQVQNILHEGCRKILRQDLADRLPVDQLVAYFLENQGVESVQLDQVGKVFNIGWSYIRIE